MFATIAAVLFAIALLLELLSTSIEGIITPTTLVILGFVFVALHLAGYGSNWGRGNRGGRR